MDITKNAKKAIWRPVFIGQSDAIISSRRPKTLVEAVASAHADRIIMCLAILSTLSRKMAVTCSRTKKGTLPIKKLGQVLLLEKKDVNKLQ